MVLPPAPARKGAFAHVWAGVPETMPRRRAPSGGDYSVPGYDPVPTAGHLASWAKLSPRTIQSGASNRSGKTGKGNPYLKGVLGEAAAAAARTDTFLSERYRRLVKRIGKLKVLVAVASSILVIIRRANADTRGNGRGSSTVLARGYQAASRCPLGARLRGHVS